MQFGEAAKYKNVVNIKDLKIPIAIITTDLIQNKKMIFTNKENLQGEEYIKDIEIGKAVRASCSFPGIYSPLEYKKYQFIDGGIFDNLPVEEVKKLGINKTIAVKFDLKTNQKHNSIYNIAMHAIDLMTKRQEEDSCKLSDVLLNIDVKGVKVFNINKINFCYEQGYNQTIEKIDKIKKKLGIKLK